MHKADEENKYDNVGHNDSADREAIEKVKRLI